MEYCHNCGEPVSPDDRFCDNCRADLSADDGSGRGGSGWSDDQQGTQSGWSDDQQPQQEQQSSNRQQQGRQSGQPTNQGRRQGGQGHQQGGQGRRQGQRAPGGGQQRLPQDSNGVFGFAFGYPVRDSWKPLLLSSVLILFSFLLIPGLIVAGYGFRVARAAALGRPNPPKFDDWGGFIFDGLRLLAVTLIPSLALMLIVGVGLLGALATDALAVLVLLLIVAYVALLYAIYAFMTAFVGSNSVIGAFTDGRATSLLASGHYLKSVLLFIVFNIALSILISIASITFVGIFIGAAFQIIAFGAFWGYVYYRAVEKGIVPPATPDGQTAGQHQGGQSGRTGRAPR